jgi:Tfp pilus assembly PilM family ATPase
VRIWRSVPESSIGLDIGHSAVKVAVLEGSRMTAWAVVDLPPGAVQGGLVRDVQGVAEIVRQAARITGLADRPVYSALSGAVCVVRRLNLPHLSGRVLRGAIRWEAERVLPYPFDQSVVDYRVLGTSMNGAGQELDILMVGARAEAVQSYVATLQSAGVRMGGLDVKPLARARALDQDLDSSAAVILHVGSESLEFTAVDERGVRFTRTVPIAAPDPHHTAVPLQFLIEETVRSMRFIEGQMPAPVDRLLLTGGGAADPGILSALEHRLNVKVVVADPLSELQHDAEPPQRLRLAVAIGLARHGTQGRSAAKRKAIWQ